MPPWYLNWPISPAEPFLNFELGAGYLLRSGRIFLTIDTMHKVEKSREGKFIKIPPRMNANLTAGNVLVSLHYNCAFEGWEMLTFPP